MAIRIHPTALIEDGVEIGEDTAVWDAVHIRAPSSIGRNCIIGEKSYIAYGVEIGDRVKINAFVYICTAVTIETGVMIAAGTIFTNDRFPRATTPDLSALRELRTGRTYPSDPSAGRRHHRRSRGDRERSGDRPVRDGRHGCRRHGKRSRLSPGAGTSGAQRRARVSLWRTDRPITTAVSGHRGNADLRGMRPRVRCRARPSDGTHTAGDRCGVKIREAPRRRGRPEREPALLSSRVENTVLGARNCKVRSFCYGHERQAARKPVARSRQSVVVHEDARRSCLAVAAVVPRRRRSPRAALSR